ncbi:nickel/cobalt efflux protein RcnA [Aquisphaera giovannonii]|uniref:Nickel/cobalt efflux protein RcnA n=1 Tax=Aquisphaera giovannonii TaxID=406548 RepID=A0A5B9W142_9BACT|nr:sulfite exporter TauE/SafE family protein [Aquisphaera giovannonii]QEH33989.1 nickel/cobalt efflux protein RcnA [Aquisphaera giovannonii]
MKRRTPDKTAPRGPARAGRRAGRRSLLLGLLWLLVTPEVASPHDIPNERIDRSIQATVRPGRLEIDYEVSLTELTLTQDLRRLIGSLPGGEREEWLKRYGEVTGPLNAKGFIVECAGSELSLSFVRYRLVVEEHPRYTFHLEADLPSDGPLAVQDTNYASSEGTSRLAIRGGDGVRIEGDALAPDVEDIPIRPVWQLDDEQERRTRRVAVTVRFPEASSPAAGAASAPAVPSEHPTPAPASAAGPPRTGGQRLSSLLDEAASASWLGLLAAAAALGAVHAIQPGHGKTLVSAVALGPGSSWIRPALLAVVTTAAHTGSVLLIAAGLWWTGASQVAGLHEVLAQVAGFAIAAAGFYRLGRQLGGRPGHDHGEPVAASPKPSLVGLIGLGLAGGLVPCWDAVGLLVLAAAIGRLGTGIVLVLAFGSGMAAVLVTVGLVAARLRSAIVESPRARRWEGALATASGLILAGIGLFLFLG